MGSQARVAKLTLSTVIPGGKGGMMSGLGGSSLLPCAGATRLPRASLELAKPAALPPVPLSLPSPFCRPQAPLACYVVALVEP